MVFPVVLIPSILEDDELGNQVLIPDFHRFRFNASTDTVYSFRAIKVEDNETSHKVFHTAIATTTAQSVLNSHGGGDYGATSAAAKVVLIIEGSNTVTLTDFGIYQGDSPDATTLLLEDFPFVSMAAGRFITTEVLTLASGKHLTVKSNTGQIDSVVGYIIE